MEERPRGPPRDPHQNAQIESGAEAEVYGPRRHQADAGSDCATQGARR